MTRDQVLMAFNLQYPLILATDASPRGLSAVLSHTLPNGVERSIAFASRTLSNAEKNYSQIIKEATAIYWSLTKFSNSYLQLNVTINGLTHFSFSMKVLRNSDDTKTRNSSDILRPRGRPRNSWNDTVKELLEDRDRL